MQRRLFKSYNFFHLINDTKATTILASRGNFSLNLFYCRKLFDVLYTGAELIEEMRAKRMDEQVENERRILEKIKIKMDRIKANQQKIQGDIALINSNFFERYLNILFGIPSTDVEN